MNISKVVKLSVEDRFIYWIKERLDILHKRESGVEKPWTDDEILQSYRFCNVRREDDKVTKWIATNWREPYRKENDLWFAMAVARFINWPDTLEEIGFPIPWNPEQVHGCMDSIKRRGDKVWTSAYIVSTNGMKMDKSLYILNNVLTPMWNNRNNLRPTKRDKELSKFAGRLLQLNGISGFMAGQIIADIKYVNPLKNAKDWNTWAISGPGSRRGLNRLCGRDVNARWKESEWRTELLILYSKVNLYQVVPIHAQDLQNCLCEFDKYERVLHNEGRPRSRYKGT